MHFYYRMNALETYPPLYGRQPAAAMTTEDGGGGGGAFSYRHADDYLSQLPPKSKIGTLSLEEWEAATLYVVFAFKKLDL